MTLVLGCKLPKALAVMADCRVSYQTPYDQVDDYLQKLYQIGNGLVLGFAGPLDPAYEIMCLVRGGAGNPTQTTCPARLEG